MIFLSLSLFPRVCDLSESVSVLAMLLPPAFFCHVWSSICYARRSAETLRSPKRSRYERSMASNAPLIPDKLAFRASLIATLTMKCWSW